MAVWHTRANWKRWLVCGLYTVGITLCSLLPSKSMTSLLGDLNLPLSDKIVHFSMYGLLAILVMWAMGAVVITRFSAGTVFSACFAYGALMETVQMLFLPIDRYFSWGDMMANGLGACAGLVVFSLLIRMRRRGGGIA